MWPCGKELTGLQTKLLTTIPSLPGVGGVLFKSTTIKGTMRKFVEDISWVVYLKNVHRKPGGMVAICELTEWAAMELAQPGHHTLIQKGFAHESEAENLARSQLGVTVPETCRLKARS